MNRGGKAALLISSAFLGACTGAAPAVEVRAIANPSAAISRGGDAVAVARGQLILGNAGLALEAFRKAQRDDPSNPAILAGIGDCYSAMGRYDIAQLNYEAALALTPHDPKLLLALAAIYEREGKTARAMIARAEAAAVRTEVVAVPQGGPAPAKKVQASAAAPAASAKGSVALPRPVIGSITVELPPARPRSHLEAGAATLPMAGLTAAEPIGIPPAAGVTPVELPKPVFGDVAVALPAGGPAEALAAHAAALSAPDLAIVEPEPETAATDPAAPTEQPLPKPRLGSVTVELAAAKPAEHLDAGAEALPAPRIEDVQSAPASVAASLPPPQPAPEPPLPQRQAKAVMPDAIAPRLVRLSRGEVALVTTGKALWRSSTNVQTASGTTVRWVALASSPGRPNVRILNAARSQGLAASARTVLAGRGWRKIAVGDAPTPLRKSVVLYPKSRAALGQRLARQFNVTAQVAERDDVVLVLGRDAVDRIARQQGS